MRLLFVAGGRKGEGGGVIGFDARICSMIVQQFWVCIADCQGMKKKTLLAGDSYSRINVEEVSIGLDCQRYDNNEVKSLFIKQTGRGLEGAKNIHKD
ncbi:hypothetical protein S83_002996 [Arachis hypogaea]